MKWVGRLLALLPGWARLAAEAGSVPPAGEPRAVAWFVITADGERHLAAVIAPRRAAS